MTEIMTCFSLFYISWFCGKREHIILNFFCLPGLEFKGKLIKLGQLKIINLKLNSVTYSTEIITANLDFVPEEYKE